MKIASVTELFCKTTVSELKFQLFQARMCLKTFNATIYENTQDPAADDLYYLCTSLEKLLGNLRWSL